MDILNSSKNCVMKWSVNREKGMFTREVAGKHKVFFSHLLKIAQKYQRIEVVQLYET